MSIYGAFDISSSGLQAQRVRMDAITANLANQRTPEFEVMKVRFGAGNPVSGDPLGVHVAGIDRLATFNPVKDPDNPAAREDGFVYYPAVDYATAMVDGIEALRAYEANIQAVEATRSMIDAGLRVLA
ncbi:MAG: flagellar basal body protein [Phycisphaerales bacterium]|jgi:flagellar basal-body rod protein FlgC|nr:flagellar basal body protein [Phycisphaerales bacterium]